MLASRGYDVWLANIRGNVYSTNHTKLDVEDEQFWQFSTDEIIQHDLPAIIDYILELTSRESLSYIGKNGCFRV